MPYLHRIRRARCILGKCRTRLNKTVRHEMKIVLAAFYTVFCIIFSVIWMGLMAYGMGMGGMGGSMDIPSFSRFWMVAPVILSGLCVVASWLPLRDAIQSKLGLCLYSLAALSLLLTYDGVFTEKILTALIGCAPLHILQFAWPVRRTPVEQVSGGNG